MQKLLWSTAIVATLLVVIQLSLSFFGAEREEGERAGRSPFQLAVPVLLFLTFFAWTGILVDLWAPDPWNAVRFGVPVGLLVAAVPVVLNQLKARQRAAQQAGFDLQEALTSTGEVCQYVRADAHGRTGKVHLNMKNAPRFVDAISNGQDIPVGAPVRVVEIRNDRVLVVEPISGGDPPHLPA